MSSRRSRRRAARLAAAALALAIAAAAAEAAALARMWGCCFKLSIVATGSMEPAVPRYSLVLVEREYPGWIPVGEVVLYRFESTREYVLHRLVNATLWDGLVTRGDAVQGRGEPIPRESVWGRLVWGLPRAALPALRVAGDPGAVFIVSLFIAAVIAGALVGRR